ncbi:MAG: phosphatase PAP2 family protein [Deltaproteobacteria bacterium]|nr:phosphatase PAP2 family protein [Deltaproteobacteria bacterium]
MLPRLSRPRLLGLALLALGMLAVWYLGWDQPVGRFLQEFQTTEVGRYWALAAHWAGLGGLAIGVLVVGVLVFWRLKKPGGLNLCLRGLGAVVVSGLLSQLLKHLVGRPRPGASLLPWEPFDLSFSSALQSFPSGHATTSFALAAVLAERFPRLAWVFYVLAGLIATGRVMGGSHYLTDVLGGAMLGLLVGWYFSSELFSFSHERRPLSPGRWSLVGVVTLALALLLLWGGLGHMPLTDRDEGEYAAVTAAMRQTGDYLVPTLNGAKYLEKPPLIYWAIRGSEVLLGQGEAAARFPAALAAIILVLGLGLWVWRLSGSPALAALTQAALAFTPLFLLVGRASLTDMVLTLFTTGALGCFFQGTEETAPHDRWWYLAGWAFLGLGFLTKGPVAPAVVLPAALIYAWAQGRLGTILRRSQIIWGVLVFLAINLPWYGYMFYHLGDEFWQGFFWGQNLRRFSEVLLGHGGGVFFYLPVLLLGAFPFCAPALSGLGAALFQNPRAVRWADPLARARFLAAIALLSVLVIFSVAATKQLNYILPALPFLAVLAGYELWRLVCGAREGRVARGVFGGTLLFSGGLWTAVTAAAPAVLYFFWDKIQASIRFDSSEYALPGQPPLLILWPLLAALVALALVLLPWLLGRRGRRSWVPLFLSGGGAVFAGILVLGLLGQAAQVVQEPAKELAQEAVARLPQARTLSYGLWKPSLIYYLDRPMPRFKVIEEGIMGQDLRGAGPALVFSRVRLAPELAKVAGYHELARRGGYLLGGNAAAAAAWAQAAAPASPPAPVPVAAPTPAPSPAPPATLPATPPAAPPTGEGGRP